MVLNDQTLQGIIERNSDQDSGLNYHKSSWDKYNVDAEPTFLHPDNYINIDQQITPDIQDQLNIDFYKDKINQSKDYYSHK